MSSRAAYRRRQSRRSTITALAGVVGIALAVVLSLSRVVGDVVPTVLAVVGVGCLITGIASAATLIAESARYHQNQSYYDDE